VACALALAQLSHHVFTLRSTPVEGWPTWVDGLPFGSTWPGPNSLELVWSPLASIVNLLAAMVWSLPLALLITRVARDAMKAVALVVIIVTLVVTLLADVAPWWIGGAQLSAVPAAGRGPGRLVAWPDLRPVSGP